MPEDVPQIKVDPVKNEAKKFNWKRVVFLLIGGAAVIFAALSSYYYLQLSSVSGTPSLSSGKESTASAQKNSETEANSEELVTIKDNLPFTFGHPKGWHVYIDTTQNENKETHIWLDERPVFVSASGRPPGKTLIRDQILLGGESTASGITNVQGALAKAKERYANSKEQNFEVDRITVYKLSGTQDLTEFEGGGSVNSTEFYLGFRSSSDPQIDHIVSFSVAGLSSETPQEEFTTLEKIVKSLKFTTIVR